jgi:hypothetical protein
LRGAEDFFGNQAACVLPHHKEVIANPAGFLSVNRGRSFGVPANGCLMQAAFASQCFSNAGWV